VLMSVTDYPAVPFPIFVTSCPKRLRFSLWRCRQHAVRSLQYLSN
jgi:hypothetical protein